MYVLAHKGRVQVGPMGWNRALFDGSLERLNIRVTLPKLPPETLPLEIDADTKIYQAVEDIPEFNAKTHYKEGPYWVFSDVATATYLVKEQPIESVKYVLKQEAAAERYEKEISGAKLTLSGKEYTVDTARGTRDVFVQKFLLMGDSDTVTWKFPEGWKVLSKAELGQVVQAGSAHVEGAFQWEVNKAQEIDACTTLEALSAVVIKDPAPQNQPG